MVCMRRVEKIHTAFGDSGYTEEAVVPCSYCGEVVDFGSWGWELGPNRKRNLNLRHLVIKDATEHEFIGEGLRFYERGATIVGVRLSKMVSGDVWHSLELQVQIES